MVWDMQRLGRTIEVVDTPGIFDTDQDNHMVHKEMLKAYALTTPGFHAIAFVLMRGKFTEELQKTQDLFFEWFGQGVEKFAFVILTDTDRNEVRDKFLNNKPHPKLTQMIQKCNERVVALDNSPSNELQNSQVEDILRVVEEIKSSNDNRCFSNVAYKLAESYVRNNCSQELSLDSLRILNENGMQLNLTEGQAKYIRSVCSSKDTRDESDTKIEIDSASDTSSDNEELNPVLGNLRLFDNKTNEPISGDSHQVKQSKRKRMHSSGEQQSDTYRTLVRGISSCVNDEVPGKTGHMTEVFMTENEVDYGPSGLSELYLGSQQRNLEKTVEEQKQLGKKPIDRNNETCERISQDQVKSKETQVKNTSRGSRANRVIDLNSVHTGPINTIPGNPEIEDVGVRHHAQAHSSRASRVVDLSTVEFVPEIRIPEETAKNVYAQHNVTQQSSRASRVVDIESVQVNAVNQFKNKVNTDDKELDGFAGLIKRAVSYCKKKTCCILL